MPALLPYRSQLPLRSAAASSLLALAGTSFLVPYALLVQFLSTPLAQFKPGTPVPSASVAMFVGHGTIQMTMRYAHLIPDLSGQASDKMMSFYHEQAADSKKRKSTRKSTRTSGEISTPAKSL